MRKQLYSLAILFNFTAIFGYIMEVIGTVFYSERILDRGFLNVPVLPIYGVGSILIAYFLWKKHYSLGKNFLIIFFMASLFEYLSHLGLEAVFHQTWWDYSNYAFNIKGRIALWSSLGFGLGGVIVLRYVYPLINNTVDHIKPLTASIFSWPLVIATVIDTGFTAFTLLQ